MNLRRLAIEMGREAIFRALSELLLNYQHDGPSQPEKALRPAEAPRPEDLTVAAPAEALGLSVGVS